MFGARVSRRTVRLIATWAVLSATMLPGTALGQSAGVEPQVEKLLKAATSYLAGQKQFSVLARSTTEVVLTSGQKLQFDSAATLLVQRPNKLRAERRGDLVDQEFTYNGRSLTLYNPSEKYYATVAAPDTLGGMLDYARESLDIVAPAGDLHSRPAFQSNNLAYVVVQP